MRPRCTVCQRQPSLPVNMKPEATGGRVLLALVVGQLGLHSAMAGLRMAAPLQTLREGWSAWSVGVLLALFAAAPVLLALHAGRLADRHGYHKPVGLAVALSLLGMAMAAASSLASGGLQFALLAAAAMPTGAGANMGMLTIQRTAGLAARDAGERIRIFSWLGVAPSLSNVVGPVSAGFVIDAAGFGAAYLMLLALPLATLLSARRVPRLPAPGATRDAAGGSAVELLNAPGMKRLLLINWLMSMCWDVHTFAVPVLGHEAGFSASVIGLVLGCFTLAVSGIRMLVPLVADRLQPVQVLRMAMLGTGAVFAAYPWARTPWQMAGCAVLLGLTLGIVQPIIMNLLHHLTPDQRHGEALALRSMAINTSSTVMPLLFGALGTAVGAAVLFWSVGLAVAGGSFLPRSGSR